jgi:hypothetical protein
MRACWPGSAAGGGGRSRVPWRWLRCAASPACRCARPTSRAVAGPILAACSRASSSPTTSFAPASNELLASLADPGVLIYETFMVGNERFGRPASPQNLLQSQEMLGWAPTAGWQVVAFEEGLVDSPRPAMVQRLCAVRGAARRDSGFD